ncbi:nuclear transport factor 2 family protein [Flavobacterium sp. J27]|uniref:nuclear transport factor 2 family protein n=1 Tax=Flavobacterium sp. J27 TaxID=2060419 RepID=UPI0010323BBF|nr:nuclear transport factor 2 family protein [Flavobacterium sp. J27]
MTNLEILKSTYEGAVEEKVLNLQKHLDKNVTWKEAEGFPYSGTYIGFDEVVKLFIHLGNDWIDYKIDVEDFVVDGDKIVAYGTYSGINKKTNKSFEARVAHLFKFKNAKIISYEQFVDSQKVIQAMQ